jgi:hypothetical protein
MANNLYFADTDLLIKYLIKGDKGSICFRHINEKEIEFPTTPIRNFNEIFLCLTGDIKTIGIYKASYFYNNISFFTDLYELLELGFNVILSDLDKKSENRILENLSIIRYDYETDNYLNKRHKKGDTNE